MSHVPLALSSRWMLALVGCAGGPAVAPTPGFDAPAPSTLDTSEDALLSDTGLAMEETGCVTVRAYADADADGHGDPATAVDVCTIEAGLVATGDDCDDASEAVFPGAPELCDGRDNDCDGLDVGTCEVFATEALGTWEGGGLMTEAIPDVTGDGVMDFAVVATYSRAYVVPGPMLGTGRTGDVAVFSVDAGYSLNNGAGAGDVTGDGVGDLWFGSLLIAGPVVGSFASELEVIPVAVGDFAASGPGGVQKNDMWGLPDVTGDGIPDALVPYRWSEEFVHLIDGPFLVDEDPYETALLTVIDDFDEYGGDDAGNEWGEWMHEAGDTDGDGVAELIVMDVTEGFPGAYNDNYVYFISTASRGTLSTEDLVVLDTPNASGAFGAGDVNADGYDDILVPNDCSTFLHVTDSDGCVVLGPVAAEGGIEAQVIVGLVTTGSAGPSHIGQATIGTSLGDGTGDGIADIAIGGSAVDEDEGGRWWVLPGAEGLSGTLETPDVAAYMVAASRDGSETINGYTTSYGRSTKTSYNTTPLDVDGDGWNDLVLGLFGDPKDGLFTVVGTASLVP